MAAVRTELSSGLRNPALRRHLPDEIAIAGIGREMQEAFAVARLDPGLHVDGLALGAPAVLDWFEVRRADQLLVAALMGEKDAAFLEGFADAGNAKLQLVVRQRSGTRRASAQLLVAVGVLELAAGKYQSAGEGIDLVMPHHH